MLSPEERDKLLKRLDDEAVKSVEAHRTFTDMRYGTSYLSLELEQTHEYQAAALIRELIEDTCKGCDENIEAMEVMLKQGTDLVIENERLRRRFRELNIAEEGK